jgi:hypothetical protein
MKELDAELKHIGSLNILDEEDSEQESDDGNQSDYE